MELAAKTLQGTEYSLVAGDREFSGPPEANVMALLIRSATTVGADIREHFPNLKSIIRVGVGLDNVDLDFCKKAGITVFNAPGANASAVSDYVVGMVLYALRGINRISHDDVVDWNRFKVVGRDISDQTFGIVGFGHIGRLLYQTLVGFGCHDFIVYDPYLPQNAELPEYVRMATLEELLEQSDVISLHMPLTDETRHMINADALAKLKPKAVLVNAARGGIVDEAAVRQTVEATSLTYIADTVEGEPHVSPALLGHERIIVTPHIAGVTEGTEKNMVVIALQRFLGGEPVKL